MARSLLPRCHGRRPALGVPSTSTTLATVSSQGNAANTFVIETAAINAALGTTADAFDCMLTRVSSPGGFYGAAELEYRLIGP